MSRLCLTFFAVCVPVLSSGCSDKRAEMYCYCKFDVITEPGKAFANMCAYCDEAEESIKTNCEKAGGMFVGNCSECKLTSDPDCIRWTIKPTNALDGRLTPEPDMFVPQQH